LRAAKLQAAACTRQHRGIARGPSGGRICG